jgi:hypothetical protein
LSADTKDPANNGAVLNIAQLIKVVKSLAAEAKLGALYIKSMPAKQSPCKTYSMKWDIHNHELP